MAQADENKMADMPLHRREELVHSAVDSLFSARTEEHGYCCAVFDTYAIVRTGEEYWRAEYTLDSNGDITFNPRESWVRVENQWVEAKMAQLRQDGIAARGDHITKAYVKDGQGIVEAVGLRFGSPDERDLEDDYFTAETDFGHKKGNGVAATRNHRMPLFSSNTTKTQLPALEKAAKRFFKNPVKTLVQEDIGIVVQHVLDLADEYEKTVFELAKQGKFRWSSGSAPHMVDRDTDGRIKTWHILEWAYTPYAAEPRLPTIAPTKSLAGLSLDFQEASEEVGDTSKSATKEGLDDGTATNKKSKKGNKKMDEQELKLFQEQFAKTLGEFKVTAVETPIKALNDRFESFEGKVTELLNKFESMPEGARAGYMTNDGGTKDASAKSFGDFLLAIRRGDTKRLAKVYGSMREADEGETKATMVVDSGSAGGYLVPEEYAASLLQVTPMSSPILSRVQVIPVSRTSGEWPCLDQYFVPTAGVGDTAFAGSVETAITAEAGLLTETQPAFKMLQWRVHKIGGYTQVSNELIADSPMAIEALLRGLFNVAVSAKQEYFILRGNGVGAPLGILNSAAAIGISPATNNLFSWPDVATMQSRFKQVGTAAPVWVIHPSVWPDILQMEVGTAGANAWVSNMQAAQGNMLNGYQIVQSEHMPQANNSGNVLLADLYAYTLFRREALSIAFSEHYGFLNDLGTWRFTARADGQPWLRGPITLADPQGSYTVSPFVYHND